MSEDATARGSVPTTYERLTEHFPTEAHKKVKKGGREQTYVPWTDKVERLNGVLGSDWSFRIIREGMTDTEAWVLGEITATIDGVVTVRQQYGCEPITRGQDAKPVTDLFKIAGTDALSKAATLFGCGLYLSIQEEREAVEAEMRAAVQAEAEQQAAERAAQRPQAPASTSSAATTAPSSGAPARPETTRARWQRLVSEAEQANLDTIGRVKAIDPKAVGEAQLKKYADQLEARLKDVRAA